jgi:hypothetical protein
VTIARLWGYHAAGTYAKKMLAGRGETGNGVFFGTSSRSEVVAGSAVDDGTAGGLFEWRHRVRVERFGLSAAADPGGGPYGAGSRGPSGTAAGRARCLGGLGDKVPPRTAAERDRLEAELLALGERQHAGVDTSKPNSVIQELQELGRRSRAETEQLIQSGAVPETP